MMAKSEIAAESGLQFFGKMTASISHEIKNVLAIINENAGLLEDFALLAEQGATIDPQRLKNMSQTLMKQVSRADAIAKNMNRLSHSIDDAFKTIDLINILELLVALSDRFASMRGVVVQAKLNQDSVKIKTAPFFLLNFLWLCLDFAMDSAGEEKTVLLITQKAEDSIDVFFKGLGGLAGATLKPFPAELEKGLCSLLGAELEVNTDNQEMVVRIVKDIDSI